MRDLYIEGRRKARSLAHPRRNRTKQPQSATGSSGRPLNTLWRLTGTIESFWQGATASVTRAVPGGAQHARRGKARAAAAHPGCRSSSSLAGRSEPPGLEKRLQQWTVPAGHRASPCGAQAAPEARLSRRSRRLRRGRGRGRRSMHRPVVAAWTKQTLQDHFFKEAKVGCAAWSNVTRTDQLGAPKPGARSPHPARAAVTRAVPPTTTPHCRATAEARLRVARSVQAA